MSKVLPVRYEGELAYSIHIEEDFSALGQSLREAPDAAARRVLVVTDENVAPLYLAEVQGILSSVFAFCDAVVLPAGEEHKNTRTLEQIYTRLVEDGFDRKDYLAALGGGVVGDMCGFAAATYMRGIRFLQIPTTLLSQVDSSIGGKTGVDFRQYKNMVGAFHMPSLVYTSLHTLRSLDGLQFASGMGEVVKHALIRDADYLAFLRENREGIAARSYPVMEELLFRSDAIKRAVVEADPKEEGERRLLNFGHTLGHALEKCSHFRYTHGQCVAWGCLCALRVSLWHGADIPEAAVEDIRSLLSSVGLETTAPVGTGSTVIQTAEAETAEAGRAGQAAGGMLDLMDPEEVLEAVKRDKKMSGGQIRFILLRSLGEAYVSTSVTREEMQRALAAVSFL